MEDGNFEINNISIESFQNLISAASSLFTGKLGGNIQMSNLKFGNFELFHSYFLENFGPLSSVQMTNCYFTNLSTPTCSNTKTSNIYKGNDIQQLTVEGCTFSNGNIHPIGNILPDWDEVSSFIFSNTSFSNIHQHQTTESSNNKRNSVFYSLGSSQTSPHRNISYSFCTFQQMSAKRGSVFCFAPKSKDSGTTIVDISLCDCRVIDCWAEEEGGAINIVGEKMEEKEKDEDNFYSASLFIKNSTFQNVKSKYGGGGAVFILDCDEFVVSSSIFSYCFCETSEKEVKWNEESFTKEGGAIICFNTKATSITKAVFSNNNAVNGGAISIHVSEKSLDFSNKFSVEFTECTFVNNTIQNGFLDVQLDSNVKMLNESVKFANCLDNTEGKSAELAGFCLDESCDAKEVHNEWLGKDKPAEESHSFSISAYFKLLRSNYRSFNLRVSPSSAMSSSSDSDPLTILSIFVCCVMALTFVLFCIFITIKVCNYKRLKKELLEKQQNEEEEEKEMFKKKERRVKRREKLERKKTEQDTSMMKMGNGAVTETSLEEEEEEEEDSDEAENYDSSSVRFASFLLTYQGFGSSKRQSKDKKAQPSKLSITNDHIKREAPVEVEYF
eukprot:MONOS_5991.1-p1 / transcript=MONOS_5991.1 / gene=MONOS_5991 / organism=Monocercomonoides_exilis_PA203 / gene_product=unspecified product / transcript_product=unspecified product / location=Mono_scaffold00182:45281-47119(-) / protein_length=613 / sequence_SO=supercontig / SO=protein_coding / is_pseudo=false